MFTHPTVIMADGSSSPLASDPVQRHWPRTPAENLGTRRGRWRGGAGRGQAGRTALFSFCRDWAALPAHKETDSQSFPSQASDSWCVCSTHPSWGLGHRMGDRCPQRKLLKAKLDWALQQPEEGSRYALPIIRAGVSSSWAPLKSKCWKTCIL